MSKETTIRIQYIVTAIAGFLLNCVCEKITTEAVIYNTYLKLALMLFPYFIRCIYIPFAITSLLRFVVKPIYESKVFYMTSYIYLIINIAILIRSIPEDTVIFYIIFFIYKFILFTDLSFFNILS